MTGVTGYSLGVGYSVRGFCAVVTGSVGHWRELGVAWISTLSWIDSRTGLETTYLPAKRAYYTMVSGFR